MFSTQGCVPDIHPRECIKKYWGVVPNTLPREQEVYWIILSLKIMSINTIPIASEYQEIYPYSVVNIDNVKVNIQTWFSLIPDTRNTR